MEDDPRSRAVQSILLRWGYTPVKAVNSQTIQLLAAADAVDPLRQPMKPTETVPAAVFTPEMRKLLYHMAMDFVNNIRGADASKAFCEMFNAAFPGEYPL